MHDKDGSQMGPLVSNEQYEKVVGYMESGKNDGAECLVGGTQIILTVVIVSNCFFKN